MRKLLTTVLLVSFFSTVMAQKLDDVEEKFSKGKLDEAKEKIDKVLAEPKNASNAKAWYLKGKIYSELARQDSTGALTFDAGMEAFEAFKKYQQLDAKNVLMLLEQNVGLFQLYDFYYNQGIKSYNEKKYDNAFAKMKNAMALQEYISSKQFSYNGFSFPALDTQLVNLTAFSAYLAKKEAESMPYFERLADAKINEKEYKEIYGLLAEYYLKNNNTAKADKYLALGKEVFPDNDYWIGLEFGTPGKEYKEQVDKLTDELNSASDADRKAIEDKLRPVEDKLTQARLTRYEQMIAKYPSSYPLAMDYAIEAFNYTYSNDKKPGDYVERQARTDAALKKAAALNPNTALVNYVMSQHIYNQIYDLEDAQRAVKGTGAADVAKRKDFTARIDKKYEELYPFSLKAYEAYSAETSLKIQDKVNLRKVIDQLIDYHGRKKQADKEAFYKEKLKAL